MTSGERMILSDAIEQAIDSEKAKIKMKKWLFILSVACLILIASDVLLLLI